MKNLILTILIGAFAITARAQFVQGPAHFSAITNQTTWQIRPADGGGAATNIATTQATWCQVGGNGFGVLVKAYGTNAALTTNTWFTLEYGVAVSGTIYPVSNSAPVVVYLPVGVATNTYYTNIVNTTANSGNIDAVRLKSVMQTNGVIGGSLAGNLFVEKFVITTR